MHVPNKGPAMRGLFFVVESVRDGWRRRTAGGENRLD
jgi:hypothetical protein